MKFIDLKAQYYLYQTEIMDEVTKVMDSAQFIMGPAVSEFERELEKYVEVKNAIACSSGTDALMLALLAKEIKARDEVIVPDFTFIATAEVVAFLGAVPVFVDVKEDSFNIDPYTIEQRLTDRTKGIIVVSLFGQCAEMEPLLNIAERYGLWVIEDAAQSFGATNKGRKSCGIAEISTTSFYPAKPIGCYGDGGAVFTSNDEIARRVRLLINHGQGATYCHEIIGLNARMDSIQAAVLQIKLKYFDEELKRRREIAKIYTELLQEWIITPVLKSGNESTWAQYTIRSAARDKIRKHLKEKGIPTAIHYPLPLHAQKCFNSNGFTDSDFPVSSQLSREVLSLPMHAFLSQEDAAYVAKNVKEALA